MPDQGPVIVMGHIIYL